MANVIRIEYNEFAEKGSKKGALASVIAAAEKVRSLAVSRCPFKDGQLANSIMYETEEEGESGFNESDRGGEPAPNSEKLNARVDGKISANVGTNSDHWYPEFGTRYQQAQPFLRPAGQIVKGDPPGEVAKRFSNVAMAEEFRKRRKRKRQSRF